MLESPSYLLAMSKFAIRSTVHLENPALHRFLHHLGNSASIQNDLASYEKEKRHFETGRSASMINIVHTITELERLSATEAKTMAYAWQLFMENETLRELEELKRRDELSGAEWRFVEACLLMAGGNLLASVVVSRYGGEDARIV